MGLLILLLVLAGCLCHWWIFENLHTSRNTIYWPVLLIGALLCGIPLALFYH